MAPIHLFVLQHGLNGSFADLAFIEQALKHKFAKPSTVDSEGRQLHLLLSNTNTGYFNRLTHHGLEVMGMRLYEEILKEIEKINNNSNGNDDNNIDRISMLGFSLGGLIVRYTIGILYRERVFEKIKPATFVSFSSPHCGSRRKVGSFWNYALSTITSYLFGKTGLELTLEDVTDDSETPLLVKITELDSDFYKGLALFHNRILYSNVFNDIQVPYSTSSISHRNPYNEQQQQQQLTFLEKYPHILETKQEIKQVSESNYDEYFANDAKAIYLRIILKNLQTLEWKRYDCYFQGLFVHTRIVGKNDLISYWSKDVVQHFADHFEL